MCDCVYSSAEKDCHKADKEKFEAEQGLDKKYFWQLRLRTLHVV